MNNPEKLMVVGMLTVALLPNLWRRGAYALLWVKWWMGCRWCALKYRFHLRKVFFHLLKLQLKITYTGYRLRYLRWWLIRHSDALLCETSNVELSGPPKAGPA